MLRNCYGLGFFFDFVKIPARSLYWSVLGSCLCCRRRLEIVLFWFTGFENLKNGSFSRKKWGYLLVSFNKYVLFRYKLRLTLNRLSGFEKVEKWLFFNKKVKTSFFLTKTLHESESFWSFGKTWKMVHFQEKSKKLNRFAGFEKLQELLIFKKKVSVPPCSFHQLCLFSRQT